MNCPASATSLLTGALIELGSWLKSTGYRFVTPTPATHGRINSRAGAWQSASLRDVFGWSRPFAPGVLPRHIQSLMQSATLLDEHGPLLRSRVRFSSLCGDLYAHSAYPTDQPDAVFFGPDTYRFASLIKTELERRPVSPGCRILDVGCGAGPGGIVAAKAGSPSRPSLTLTDINAVALQFASANAALGGVAVTVLPGDLFAPVDGEFGLIVANPPYLNDHAGRVYRHGGGQWGSGLSERIVREGVHRLAPGGRLVLYTGVAIVEGGDPFFESVQRELDAIGWPWSYRELDPDVFGEELQEPAYAGAERIAAVALAVTRPAA